MIDAAVERYPDIIAIVITGYGTVRDAVGVIKRGATDFVTKPFQFDELMHALERRDRTAAAEVRERLSARAAPGALQFDGIVGRSRAMRDLFQPARDLAPTASTILMTGETGTGKEVVARAIHHNSPRRAQRFVAINCSAIPETLLEAELFGHVRGAFTGAIGTRQGRIEQAHRGTLFLDEVGTMSMSLQIEAAARAAGAGVRARRRLADDEGGRPRDCRHKRRPRRMVAEGTFREDLYYRLNVIPVRLPPLRERKEDIPLLVPHFLEKFCAEGNRSVMTISQAAMRALMAYAWPGNIRQLENAMERAVALSGGRTQIESADLPPEIRQAADEPPTVPACPCPREGSISTLHCGHRARDDSRSLERTNGNKGAAARVLNLKRTTLVEKLKRLERS